MDSKEILKMCEKIAYKYNRPEDFEDIVQEAVLACYEVLAVKDEPHPAELYRAAQKRAYDYVNFDTHGLTIPASDTARSVSRKGEAGESSSWSDEAVDHLTMVLHSEWGEYDDEMVEGDSLSAEMNIIKTEERQNFINTVLSSLKPDEMKIIRMRYYEDMTQDEVADVLGITREAVSQRETKILKKLKKSGCNNSLLTFY